MSKFTPESNGSADPDPLLRALARQSEQIDFAVNPTLAESAIDDKASHADLDNLSEQQLLAVARFDADCRRIGSLIRSLPAQPVGSEFTLSVMRQVRQAAVPHVAQVVDVSGSRNVGGTENVRTTARTMAPQQARHRDGSDDSSWRGITSTVALVVAAVVMLMIGRPVNNQSVVELGLANRESADEFPDATSLSLPEPAADQFRPAEALVADFGATAGNAKAPSDADIRMARTSVLSEGPDWQIVVVHVDSSDREAVMQMVAKAADDLNMDIQTMPDAMQQQSESIGVLLTSAAVKNQSFLDSVTRAPQVSSSEWNPLAIGQMDRQELINAVRESMLHPTRSELHFGKIYLAMPRTNSHAVLADTAGVHGGQPGFGLAATETGKSEIGTDKRFSGSPGSVHGSNLDPAGPGAVNIAADSAGAGLDVPHQANPSLGQPAKSDTLANELIVADRRNSAADAGVSPKDEIGKNVANKSSEPAFGHVAESGPVLVVFEFSNPRQLPVPSL